MARVADTTDDDAQTGGMIALVPRTADANSMAAAGGLDVDELHLTLAYLGDDVTEWPGERVTELLGAVQAMAADYGPVTSRVLARTVFNADNPDKDPCAVYLMSDAPALVPMQDEAAGLTDVEQHTPYIPHVTGGYGVEVDQLGHTGTVVFDRIRVALAGSVTDFELVADDLDDDLDDDDDLDEPVEEKAAPESSSTQSAPASSGKKRKVASKAGEQRYGLPIGTELGQARGTESARAAQASPNAKARYDEFMTLGDTPAMKAAAGKLSDDDLKSLTAVMYSFRTSNARVVAARNALATELRKRGFDERDHGSLAGGKRGTPKASSGTAAKKPTKRKGSMSDVEDRAWRRRAAGSGGRIMADSLTDDALKKLQAAGWTGRPDDGVEALYPPDQTKDAGYLGERYEEKRMADGDELEFKGGRFVRTARGAAWFRKPIGSPIKGGTRSVSPSALSRADELMGMVKVDKASRRDEINFASAIRGLRDSEIEDVAHVISTEEPNTWRSRSIGVELDSRREREERRQRREAVPPRVSGYNQAMAMIDEQDGSDSDDPDYLAYLKEQGVDPDWADDGDMAAWRRSRAGDSDDDMDYLGLSVDGELEVKRTTSKPWETGDLKKAGHTVSKEKGAEGDKYPIKTIGDLAAAVKRAKGIKDPEQKAKVWKHLRAEAKRLKAPNMVPADAPSGDGGGKKKGGFVPFKKGEKKSALDYLLTPADRRVLAALEVKYASPDPRARRLRKYWATGPGRAKWSSFRELRRHLAGKGVPAQMLNGLTANIYHAAKGEWPGRKKGEKGLDDTTQTKVMISADLVEQASRVGVVTPELDDESALEAYDEMAVSTEDEYERALVREVDWEMGLDGELEPDDDDGGAESGPGMFDEDFEPLPDAEEDLLSAFGG